MQNFAHASIRCIIRCINLGAYMHIQKYAFKIQTCTRIYLIQILEYGYHKCLVDFFLLNLFLLTWWKFVCFLNSNWHYSYIFPYFCNKSQNDAMFELHFLKLIRSINNWLCICCKYFFWSVYIFFIIIW